MKKLLALSNIIRGSANPIGALLSLGLLLALKMPGLAAERRAIAGHVPSAVGRLQAISRLPATNQLRLVLGVPLRNQAVLDELLGELHNPASPNFHQWLTPEQFTARFGPTEEDYQKVVAFAHSQGFKVTALATNRMLVDVETAVTNAERAFQVTLRQYPHPTENRQFYAPDTEPTVPTNVPVLHISGLDNFIRPHRLGGAPKVVPLDTNQVTAYATGSSPGGYFMGSDFRKAFAPGVTNTGAGQYIAIVDVGGPYYMKDVYMYETNAGLSTNIVITNILLSGWTGVPTGSTDDDGEEVLDIDMAISMAPDAIILNYEGEAHDVFNQIAVDNKAKQMSLSYGFGIDATILQIFQQFLAQGQALSQASGDGGADPDGGTGLTGVPYSTIVGGTSLSTSGTNGPWQSEVVWGGSGGGISGYGIPTWQQGLDFSSNQGSSAYRNYPDVAMPAVNIFTVYRNGTVVGATGGTSASSPLWAGFMALVNQQAAVQGKPAVGFPNPAIYALGKGPAATYAKCFHDITSGNTYNSQNPTRFAAGAGYDLCTGWGTPTGSNTIAALVGTGTNDFTFYSSQGLFNLVAGGSATAKLTLTRLNGLSGSVTFSVAALPPGITAVITPVTTTSTSAIAITTQTNTVPGTYNLTLTGNLGGLIHSLQLPVVISAPVPGAQPINLAPYYNRAGIYTDGRTFSGGLDAAYSSFSANLLGTNLSWNGLVFNLGPANANDTVYCAGQTLPLPAGQFTSLLLLATAVQGNQTAQSFTLTYTDNSTVTVKQSVSDWANPQRYPGESTAFGMPYRNLSSGTSQSLNVNVYGYSFALDPTKTLKSITLPNNSNVILLTAALANAPVGVPLAGYYNRAGLYTDGTTFTNPATGGIDGSGYAYSATVLGGSRSWSNTTFNFGPANATNVISAAGQVITLPAGKFAALRLLATAVQGSQASQVFTVNYTDGSATTFARSLSDWYSPQNYGSESKAVIMGYRNSKDGSKDSRTFYLYGYSLALNSAKTVQSLKLPSNANVIIAAVSLVPNWQPTFINSPFSGPGIVAGQNYSVNLATNVIDLNGDSLVYAKISGPAWLNLSSSGWLTGQPLSPDVGINSFALRVSDPGGLTSTATMSILVTAAPAILSAIVATNGNLLMSWSGGISPYQVQLSTNLTQAGWNNLGLSLSTNAVLITPSNAEAFYRIVGQ